MIELDKSKKNLLLIHYPSGGYGYYLTRLINGFITNVVKTPDNFLFDSIGTSHLLPLVAGCMHFDQNKTLISISDEYQYDIARQKYILIPYCTGIHSDDVTALINTFTNAKIIRLHYKDDTWPLVFQNCITKAAQETLETAVEFSSVAFGSSDDWAKRENFFLLLKNHHYRHMWNECDLPQFLNINVVDLLTDPETCLRSIANFIDGTIVDLDLLPGRHQQFLDSNLNTVRHLEILHIVKNLRLTQNLKHIDHLYQQAVLNFYLQLRYNFEVPPNDYSDWFTNTTDIVKMLEDNNIII
jgi:hypothetical protein